MRTHKIQVKTQTKKYSIFIGSNILKNIVKILDNQNIKFSKCLVIIDKNIPLKFKFILKRKLKNKKIAKKLEPSSEKLKNKSETKF